MARTVRDRRSGSAPPGHASPVPQQRGRHKQQRHRPGPQRARHPRHQRFGSLAGLRRGTIVLVAALAATVPATAVGVGVKTVLAPTASGPPAARAAMPAPIVVDDAAPTTTARGSSFCGGDGRREPGPPPLVLVVPDLPGLI